MRDRASTGPRDDAPDAAELESPRRGWDQHAGGAPAAGAGQSTRYGGGDEMPRIRFTRRSLIASILFVVSVAAFLYFVLPKLLGLRETWNRIQHGNGWWLGVAALLEVLSFLGYIALFRGVFVRGDSRIGWRASYEITMAGLAATRLFASAGAGGVALTAWALRRSGLEARIVACRMIAFMALLYGVYMGVLVICGLGLYLGVFPGANPFAITMIPAIFGAAVILVFLGVSLLPGDFDRLVSSWGSRGRLGRIAGHAGGRSGRRSQRCADRDRARAHAATRSCWARSAGGALTSPSCGRRFTPSAARRRPPS